MSSGLSASAAMMAALLLLLGGAAHANEADETLQRLTALAREQAKLGDPKGLSGTLDDIVKALPEASSDGVSAVTQLQQYLSTPGAVERSAGSPPLETSPSPERDVSAQKGSEPAASSSPESSSAPATSAMSEPREQPSQPVQAPSPKQPETAADPPSKHALAPARTAAAAMPPAPAPAAQRPPGALNDLVDLLRRQGDSALATGDISGARRFYQAGAENGCGACAASLARTFDAAQLRRMGTVGIMPDPAQAEAWRVRARQLGQP